jgi:predicted nucleic acid-binding protein
MTFSSSLAEDPSPLILDTSVLINLHASRQGGQILAAMPNEILVSEPVVAELDNETSQANGEAHFVRLLITEGTVQRVPLSDAEYATFEAIVTGNRSLGDGEAATIAVAVARSGLAIIDERKGRSLARSLMPDREPAWSLDLFTHPGVRSALGVETSHNAIFLALRDGRMRIHEDHCDHVVQMIGMERALECTCLPNFKKRCLLWWQ